MASNSISSSSSCSSNYNPQSVTPVIPVSKYHSKSLIISTVKPLFDAINNLEDSTLRNLSSVVTKHTKENKKRKTLEIGINTLIFELYNTERMLTGVKVIEGKNVVNLGKILKENANCIEGITAAKQANPEKLQDAIRILSQESQGFEPETIVIINALMAAIPS